MVVEYIDHDLFGLDSVKLIIINNNEDVNEHIKELLKFEKYTNTSLSSIHNILNLDLRLYSNKVIPIKSETSVESDSLVMSEHPKNTLLPGSVVYMSGFVSINEMYVRKVEDHNDEFDEFLDMVNEFCLSAVPINRPLVNGEIVGALTKVDSNFYRGKVLNKINETNYSIQFIDFGDVEEVPISKICNIPNNFMTPSNIFKITIKGLISNSLNDEAKNYLTNLMSGCVPMIIDFLTTQSLENATLTIVNSNENVIERLNELLINDDCKSQTKVAQYVPENVEIHSNVILPKLKSGDSVRITAFVDVHHIYVRRIEDETDELFNFMKNVDVFCSAETPIGKLPKLNDIIGAKSIDGSFHRAKVVKKVNDVSYNVQFIDNGVEENVSLSDIVSLSTELKKLVPTIYLIQLKDILFNTLTEAAHDYIRLISANEILIINIDDATNEVILKTSKDENINEHLHSLIFENQNLNVINSKEIDNILNLHVQSLSTCNDSSLLPGSVVYMTGFVDLNEIYIRKLEDYNDEYHTFLDKVNEFCQSAPSVSRPLIIGDIIGARSSVDDCFYRGRVLKENDDASYLIHFIDYGDKENVTISNIFDIPDDFMIPSTAVKINLKGIESYAMTVDASNYISNLLSTYELMIVDFDSQFPLKDVTLVIIKNNENVTESLNKLTKNIDNTTAINILNDKYVPGIEPRTKDIIKDIKPCDEISTLKNEDMVFITAYVDIYNIFVRKVDDNEEFQKLIEKVNTYCSLGNNSDSKPPELDQIVGAKSSADGFFYRARVLEKLDEKNFNVVFIDFGFEETINVSNIVPLPLQHQEVKPSISLVGLKDSNFENLTSEGHEYLENLMLHSEVMKIEFEDLSAVTLTIVSQEQNVVDYLNQLQVNNSLMDNTIINSTQELISGIKFMSQNISIPQIPPLMNKSVVIIHAFLSLKDIYISVPFNKSEVQKFLKDLSLFCSTSQHIATNPTIGEVLGIQSSTDGSFHRGIIKDKLNENQYRVVFIDFGTEEIVPSNSFVEIPEQFKQVPQCIYVVGLKGIYSENLNAQAMSYVNMLCENVLLVIEFCENSPNGLKSVTLTVVKTQQNVNNHLATLLAEKERDSPETVQMLSKGDIVYISSFVNFHTVYVRHINNGTDRFKSFLENFSSCCALENPLEGEPKVGEIIAAKDKDSAKFYRAEVISKVDTEHFNVCFIDFGSWEIVHKKNIVKPSKLQLQGCPPTFMIGLDGFELEPIGTKIMQFIKKISQTETFIIDSFTDQDKAILISVNSQYNLNKEIKKLIAAQLKFQNDKYFNSGIDTHIEKSVITYHKLPLEIPTQVWVAEKLSSSKFLVHTNDSRNEFIKLEKQIFKDSKTFENVKSITINMPCIVYFSPSWYRGEILEVMDKVTAKVGLIDVGHFSVIRTINGIFPMPSKFRGKPLLLNIEIQPEPQETLLTTTFKIVAKKHLDNKTVVNVVEFPVDQSYGDLDNVGLPSFSSTPIPENCEQFQYNDNTEQNLSSTLSHHSSLTSPSDIILSNILTIKDVQYAKWQKGSFKTLTFLCLYKEYLIMRDHMIDDTLSNLEIKIQDYCTIVREPYSPVVNELCLAKYCDELWYRALCIKTADSLNGNITVYFLDWGVEYLVNTVYKMSREFIYLPASAYKCCLQGLNLLGLSDTTISQCTLTQVDCEIVEKLSNDSYLISCDILKTLFNSN